MKDLTSKQLSIAERRQLEQVEGIVFDIQRYSLHDGPGLRTNVFLKGCPLRCEWCANPESQNPQPELALFENNCIDCGQFDQACTLCWVNGGAGGMIDTQNDRVMVCPTGAIHWIGEQRTAGDVIQTVLRDAPFYGDGGGMTLAGGEPTMQSDMAEALLKLAKVEGISTAMETCGHTQWQVFERLLPYLDNVLFDVKHIDDHLHRMFTGIGNDLILSNLQQLAKLNAPVTIRVPLIPGFNADSACIRAIAEFVLSLDGLVSSIDLLPYHTLGKAKYQALSRDYYWKMHNRLTDADVEALSAVVKSSVVRICLRGTIKI
jgi:pyruvate formate lyase activating enzyme